MERQMPEQRNYSGRGTWVRTYVCCLSAGGEEAEMHFERFFSFRKDVPGNLLRSSWTYDLSSYLYPSSLSCQDTTE